MFVLPYHIEMRGLVVDRALFKYRECRLKIRLVSVSVLLLASFVSGQVYRWDTGEKISDTVVEPGAVFFGDMLSYANLKGANLTDVDFAHATLSHADFADAIIAGAQFEGTTSRGFTKEQLYSTQSYREKDLSGISLLVNDLVDWDFSGHWSARPEPAHSTAG